MDPKELADWAVRLLAPALPYLLARGKDFVTAVAEGLVDKTKAEVIEAVWSKVTGSDETGEIQQAAEELADKTTEGRLAVLEEDLEAALAANHDLAEAIRALADRAADDGVTVEVHGDVLGQLIAAKEVHIGELHLYQTAPAKDISPLLETYMSWVIHRAGALPLAEMAELWQDPKERGEIKLDRVYIPLDTLVPEEREGIQERLKESAPPIERGEVRRLSAIEAANRFKYLVVTGDPGAGKSTFIKYLAVCVAGEHLGDLHANLSKLGQEWERDALWPVYVELRHFAVRGLRQGRSLWEFIEGELQLRTELDGFAGVLKESLQSGGALVLLDGLDEVPEADNCRREVVKSVVDFKALFRDCRLIVTSRTYAYYRQGWQLPGFDDAQLAPFSREQQEAFIDTWFDYLPQVRAALAPENARARGASLKREIASRPDDIGKLAERPLLLTLMAALRANRPDALPPGRAEVYGQITELLLRRWEQLKAVVDETGTVQIQPDPLSTMLDADYDQIRCVLEQAAFEAHRADGSKQDVADVGEKYLAGELLEVSRRRDLDIPDVIEFLDGRAGLLEPHGEGVYRFPHRTFQEYMAAAYLCREGQSFPDRLAKMARESPELWREVVLLAGGQKDYIGVFVLVDELTPTLPAEWPEPDAPVWWMPWLAGQTLVETGNVQPSQERNQQKVSRARAWLAGLLTQGALPPIDRAGAGRTLAALGDLRPGAGLRPDGLPDIAWCDIPAGRVTLEDGAETFDVQPFRMAKYPVTTIQFQAFLDAPDGWRNPRWWEGLDAPRDHRAEPGKQAFKFDNHPRESVSWWDAVAFCAWLSARLGQPTLHEWLAGKKNWQGYPGVRLPAEWEWQWAAQGPDGREYPWGPEYIPGYANIDETWNKVGPNNLGQTTAVGMYPQGASPYGVLDMSGNVWEWCLNGYGDPKNTGLAGNADRVLRGGSWLFLQGDARCASRNRNYPFNRVSYNGFRVVCVPPSS